ncbi:hypothetical protein PS15m_006692 [Mucor circinelloides]
MHHQKCHGEKAKDAMQQVVTSYLAHEQELKAVALYYELGRLGVPDSAFESQTLHSTETVLRSIVGKKWVNDIGGRNKAVMAELEGSILVKV